MVLGYPQVSNRKKSGKTGGCFYSLNLGKQAQLVDIQLQSIDTHRVDGSSKHREWLLLDKLHKSVEDAGLAYFASLGWSGLNDEGGATKLITWVINEQCHAETGEPIFGYSPSHRAFADPVVHLREIELFFREESNSLWLRNSTFAHDGIGITH